MLEVGASIEQKRLVLESDCVQFLGGDVQPSLSTPSMIMAMELTSRDLARPHLEDGQDTVGVSVSIRHMAPTPAGAQVVYSAKVAEIDGRKIVFEVEATDAGETVGKGRHERFVVDVQRFANGVRKRFEARKSAG